MRLNFKSTGILAIFLVQINFALIISPLCNQSDFFPLFNWSLFGRVIKGYSWPIIYIHEVDGRALDNPLNYYDFFRQNSNIDFLTGQDFLYDWWKNDREGRPDVAANWRSSFESHFFSRFSTVIYSINIEKLDQVEYQRSRKIIRTEKSYGFFEYGEKK